MKKWQFIRYLCAASAISAALGCSNAHHKGSSSVSTPADRVGNGGSIVVDGVEYQLADLYFKGYQGDSYTYDDDLKARLTRLKTNLGAWAIGDNGFFDNQVFSPLIEYLFVASLPQGCNDPMDIPGMWTVQFACTQGDITWIIPRYFVALPVEQKVGAILHERMHGFAPSQPNQIVAPFVKGAVLFQSLYDENGPVKKALSQDDVDALKAMRFAARQLGLTDRQTSTDIAPDGGGLIANSRIDPSGYVSYDSQLEGVEVAVGASVISSELVGVDVGVGANVISSTLTFTKPGCLTIGANAQLLRVRWESADPCTGLASGLAADVKLTDVYIAESAGGIIPDVKAPAQIGACATINKTNIGYDSGLTVAENVQLDTVNLSASSIQIGADVQVTNSDIITTFYMGYGRNCDAGAPVSLGDGTVINASKLVVLGCVQDPFRQTYLASHSTIDHAILNNVGFGTATAPALVQASNSTLKLDLPETANGQDPLPALSISGSIIQVGALAGLGEGKIQDSKLIDPFASYRLLALTFDANFTAAADCDIESFGVDQQTTGKKILMHDHCKFEVVSAEP